MGQLSDVCLARIAAALVETGATEDLMAATLCPRDSSYLLRTKEDAVRDVFALSVSGREALPLACMATERLDPKGESESACRAVCDGIDEDDARGIHEDAGLGSWRPKRGATIPALKAACRTAGTQVSGNKDRLIAHLRRAWKTQGLGRISVSGLPLLRKRSVEEAKVAHMRFARRMGFSARNAERAYALDPGALRDYDASVASSSSLRRRAYAAAMEKHGSMRALCAALAERERERLQARSERRTVLADALRARRPWLVARPDSALCQGFVERGEPPALEHVVDVAEEMDFLYRRTSYPYILRSMRRAARDMDREFGDTSYWSKREMCRDGLIEDMDAPTPDSSEAEEAGIETAKDMEEREEAERRSRAKERALQEWLKANHDDEEKRRAELPRTFLKRGTS